MGDRQNIVICVRTEARICGCVLERNLLGPIEKFILDPLPQPLLTNCLDVGEIIAGQASAGWR